MDYWSRAVFSPMDAKVRRMNGRGRPFDDLAADVCVRSTIWLRIWATLGSISKEITLFADGQHVAIPRALPADYGVNAVKTFLLLSVSVTLSFGSVSPSVHAESGATESGARQHVAERPHIVLILADDLGWGDVGYNGSRIATPNIDKLAERGVRLTQFYVQPVCSPTRGALLTGRYPMRLGLQCGVVRPWARYGLPLDERTLPQALSQVGYRTAIIGKWHLGHFEPEYLPTRRGFQHQYGHYNGALDYFTHVRDGGHDWHRDDKPNYDKGYSTNLIAQHAAGIIAQHNKTEPLFLYVPFNAPHTPLQAPKKYIDRYADIKNPRRRTFAAMVTCMDDGIGTIMAALIESGFPANKTLVFFCSDNGGIRQLGSNGNLRAGKGTLYEGGVRVPAVAVWQDKIKPGSVVDEPLHIVDLFPTLLRLAGAKIVQPKPLDGKDAWPTIADGRPSPHKFILHNVTPFHGAIRVGDWKLIHNGHVHAVATKLSATESWELFNIREDPSEKRDLSQRRPDVVQRLKKKLTLLQREAAEPNIAPNRPPSGFRSPKVWGNAE